MPANFGNALVQAVLPEAILIGIAAVIAALALLRPRQRPDLHRWLACIGIAGSIAACVYTIQGMRGIRSGVALSAWGGGLVVGSFSLFVAVLACGIALITCLSSDSFLRRIPSRSGVFFALVLVATAAVEALAAEREMLTLYISLATLLVCLIAIGALVKTDGRGAASSFKHLVEGTVAIAVLLYGLVILYGITGSTNLGVVAGTLSRAPGIGALAIALVLLGLTGTLGVFPLRQWVGRVASSVPANPAGFMVAMGVTAGATAWVRIGVSGFGAGLRPWTWLTAVLATTALVHTAFAGLRERSLPRLIGVLASAQAAVLLLGMVGAGTGVDGRPAQGTTALLFAMVVTALATLSAFAVLAMLQAAGLGSSVSDMRGLAHRSGPAALLLALALAAMAGAPPLIGFFARVLMIESVVDSGYGWLAVIALVSTAITLVPVTRLIGSMYAETGEETPFTLGATPPLSRITAAVASASGVVLMLFMPPLLYIAGIGAGPLR